jgi:hypothetical protein
MRPSLPTRSLLLALAAVATFAGACQQAPQAQAPAASSGSTSGSTSTSTSASNSTGAGAPAPAPAVQVCDLLSAEEVSAILGKKLIKNGCSYGLDPADKEKALAEQQDDLAKAQNRAASGDLNGFMKGMMKAGAGQQKAGNAMMNQLELNVDGSRNDQTEDQVKAIYAKTSGAVRGAVQPLQPEQRGLNGLLQGLDEVSGVGDWAFATNVASVNMGLGFSIRGRILEARKGPWRLTVSATISPDPGAAELDQKLAAVARALTAKL